MVSKNFDTSRAYSSTLSIMPRGGTKDSLLPLKAYNCAGRSSRSTTATISRSYESRGPPNPERPTPERYAPPAPEMEIQAAESLEVTRSRPIPPFSHPVVSGGVTQKQSQSVRSSPKVGGRLYVKAMEKAKKLEMRLKGSLLSKSSSYEPPRESSSALSYHYPSKMTELRRAKSTRSTGAIISTSARLRRSFTPNDEKERERKNRLYGLSKTKQEDGKKRREAIALASKRRNAIPKPEDFGKIHISKAQHMYEKGVRALKKKEQRVAEEHERKLARQTLKHDFGRIPISKAGNMYNRGQRVLRQKEEKVLVKQRVLCEKQQRSSKKIPLSRADNMYTKGVQNLLMKELKIAEQNKKRIQGELAQHEFKLAEGAFALNPAHFEPAKDSEMSTSSYSWMTADTGMLTPIMANISSGGKRTNVLDRINFINATRTASSGQKTHHKIVGSKSRCDSYSDVPTVIEEQYSDEFEVSKSISKEFNPKGCTNSDMKGDKALEHAKQLVRRAKHQLTSNESNDHAGDKMAYESIMSKIHISFSDSNGSTPCTSTVSSSSIESASEHPN